MRPRTDKTTQTKSEQNVEKKTWDLGEIENLVSSLLDGSTDSIIVTDINGIIKSWNKGAEEIFGHNAKDMVGKYIGVIYPSELKDERKKWQKKILKGETIRNQRTKIYNSANELININLTLSPFKDNDDKLVGTIGIAKDITREVMAEEALLESELKHKTLIRNTLGMVYRGNPDWSAEIMGGSEKICGYTSEEINSKEEKWLNIIYPDDKERVFRAGSELVLGPKNLVQKYRIITKNGSVRWIEDYKTSRFSDNGEFLGIDGIVLDITERKEMEQEIEKYTLDLEHSNHIKDLFIDIIRHDLLNPVGIILNLVELIESTDSSREIEEELQMIKRNTKILHEMIEDSSKYAKIESIDDFVFEKIDLSNIIKDVVDSLHGAASEKGITIENEVTERYLAHVNPFIREVFFNLVSNAIKYSPENSRVIVDLKDAHTEWIISVKDNGIGIPDKYKETIFLRFERVSKEGVKGSGLGLAIVKMIVDLHNGKVWVEDNPEGGSVFYVKLSKRTKK